MRLSKARPRIREGAFFSQLALFPPRLELPWNSIGLLSQLAFRRDLAARIAGRAPQILPGYHAAGIERHGAEGVAEDVAEKDGKGNMLTIATSNFANCFVDG